MSVEELESLIGDFRGSLFEVLHHKHCISILVNICTRLINFICDSSRGEELKILITGGLFLLPGLIKILSGKNCAIFLEKVNSHMIVLLL